MIDLARIVDMECLGHRFRAVDPAQLPIGDYVFRDELDVKARTWLDIQPGEVAIDVGASWGGWTLLALAQGATVVAVEPGRYAIDVLRRNVAENGWAQRCTIVSHVLGDGSALDDGHYRAEMAQYFDVPADQPSVTLDRVVADLSLVRVDRIKIDIEGAEVALLAGAVDVLRTYRPRVIIEDHTSERQPDIRRKCCHMLADAGYTRIDCWQPERGRPFIDGRYA